jgi:hypothetical protein
MSTSRGTNGRLIHPARGLRLVAALTVIVGSLVATFGAAPAYADSGSQHGLPPIRTGPGVSIPRNSTRPAPSGTAKKQNVISPQVLYWTWVNDNSGKCLGVAGGNVVNGAPVVQWDCIGHPDQYWSAVGIDDGLYYQFHNQANPNKCLGVPGSSTNAGAQLVVWDCINHNDQFWAVVAAWRLNPNDSGYVLVNLNSALVIGVGGGYTGNGAAVVQWPWVDHRDQRWH